MQRAGASQPGRAAVAATMAARWSHKRPCAGSRRACRDVRGRGATARWADGATDFRSVEESDYESDAFTNYATTACAVDGTRTRNPQCSDPLSRRRVERTCARRTHFAYRDTRRCTGSELEPGWELPPPQSWNASFTKVNRYCRRESNPHAHAGPALSTQCVCLFHHGSMLGVAAEGLAPSPTSL